MMLKAIAFDLDGTLYPAISAVRPTIPLVIRHPLFMYQFSRTRTLVRKLDEPRDFQLKQTRILAHLLNKSESQIKDKLNKIIYQDWIACFKRIRPFPGIREVILSLRQKGYKTALLSDMPIEEKISFLKLEGLWDVAFCSEGTGFLKPHSAPFKRLLAELNCKAEETLFIGNSYKYDVRGAKACGLKTALLSRRMYHKGDLKPDYQFRNYRQLRKFLLDLEKLSGP